MPILVVVNPAAGGGRGSRTWARLRATVGRLAEVECVASEGPRHAVKLARSAAEARYERVVAVGGDGTVLEVANGLAHSATALAIVPAGTGNDTATNLAIPADPESAADLALNGFPRPIDVGQLETAQQTCYFVNLAGFGFDAEVAARVNALPRVVGGTAPYVLGVLQTLWHFRAPAMRMRLDAQEIADRVFLVAVGNGPSYGGGMRIVPDALVDDGRFDVCVVRNLGRLAVLKLVPKMYSGGHRGHPSISFHRCRELRAECDTPIRCQADGELVGTLPATFRIHAGALRCVTGGQ